MSPFQNKGVEIEHSELIQQSQQPIHYSHIFRLQNESHPLCNLYKQEIKCNSTETYIATNTTPPSSQVHSDIEIQEEQSQQTQDSSHVSLYTTTHQDSKVDESLNLNTYNLVSVVEHFGNTGSGHYTVYRRVSEKKRMESSCDVYWVGVSDSHVCRVSEEDVLAARASLLFYES